MKKKFLSLMHIGVVIILSCTIFVSCDGEIPGDEAGQNSMAVKKSILPEGSEECPNGGVSIEMGIDENANGVLDEIEVDEIEYVCNGEDAVNNYAYASLEEYINCSETGSYVDINGVQVTFDTTGGDIYVNYAQAFVAALDYNDTRVRFYVRFVLDVDQYSSIYENVFVHYDPDQAGEWVIKETFYVQHVFTNITPGTHTLKAQIWVSDNGNGLSLYDGSNDQSLMFAREL